MIKTDGPTVTLLPTDCVRLERALRDAIKFGWLKYRSVPPAALVELYDLVQATAEQYRPPEYRPSPMTSGTGTASTPTSRAPATFEETEVLLTTAQAARYLGITESYVRRLARKSAIKAETGAGDAGWRFRKCELAAWDEHREEIKRKAA